MEQPGGQRFLMISGSAEETTTMEIVAVQNWFEELKQKGPAGKYESALTCGDVPLRYATS
jgi:hypothetical protein